MARVLFNFYIDQDLFDGLKALSDRDDITQSAACRRAIRDYLVRKGILKAPKRRPRTIQKKGDQ